MTFWRSNRALVARLVVPLALASIVLVVLARPSSARDLALNLSTDLITIIITVLYVDWVLREQTKATWQGVEHFIASEAAAAGHAFIRDVLDTLELEKQIYPHPLPTEPTELQKVIHDAIRGIDRFLIEDALAISSVARWTRLVGLIEARRADTTPLISQFGSRMDPAQLTALLKFRDTTSSIVATYSLFRQFLGVPVESLPKVKGDGPEEYTVLILIRLGIDLTAALREAISITEAFHFRLQPEPDYTEETKASWAKWYARTSRKQGSAR